MKPIILILKAQFRYVMLVFWGFVLPILLFLVLVILFVPGGGSGELFVYMYNKSSDIGQFLGEVLKSINATVVYVDEVGDPKRFVLNETYKMGKAVALVYVREGDLQCIMTPHCAADVEIYSTYEVFGIVLAEAVEGALYSLIMPRDLTSRVNLEFFNLGGAQQFALLDRETKSLRLALSLSIYAVTVALSILAMLRYAGFDRRSYLSALSKWQFFIYILIAAILFNLVEAMVLLAVSKLSGLPTYWAISPYFWIAYMINFVFAVGAGILIDAIAVRRGEVISGYGSLVVFLPLVFLTGYYVPPELLSREAIETVSILPTFGTRVFAEGAVLHDLVIWEKLALPTAASAAVFVSAVALQPIIRKR